MAHERVCGGFLVDIGLLSPKATSWTSSCTPRRSVIWLRLPVFVDRVRGAHEWEVWKWRAVRHFHMRFYLFSYYFVLLLACFGPYV